MNNTQAREPIGGEHAKTLLKRDNTPLFQDVLDEEKLMLLAQGHAAFALLWAGVELGLYNLLSRKPESTLEQIAEGLSLAPRAARVLLTGLTALGVVRKTGKTFNNAPLAEQKLVEGAPDSLVPTLGWQRYIVYPGLEDFARSLRENRNAGLSKFPGEANNLYDRLRSDPFLEKVFADAMASLSRQANAALLACADFSRFRHLVDVGGGNATNALAFVRKYPQLKATVFDLPTVCEMAEARVREEGFEGRVATHPGDIRRDPFPADADLFLFSHMFSIWSQETDRELMKKTFEALPVGGALALFGMVTHDDDSGPMVTALGNPYFLAVATGDGYLHSASDYHRWLAEAGFRRVHKVAGLPLDHVLIVAEK